MKTWIQWEIIADHAIAARPFTAMCSFDKEKVDSALLRQLASVHPLSSASGPVPSYRIFSDGHAMHIEGRVDSYAITQLWLALETLPERADVVVDLATARLMGPGVLAGLTQLCDCGIGVRIRGERSAIDELRDSLHTAIRAARPRGSRLGFLARGSRLGAHASRRIVFSVLMLLAGVCASMHRRSMTAR